MAKHASVNDKIHDDLITHDIRLQRITGDCRNRAERRLDKLQRDLRGEIARIDPFGANRKDTRQRRLNELQRSAKELTAEAYREIALVNHADLKRVAMIETQATAQALESALT